jgi:DNA-binding transcriptional LysR family regulator
MDRFSAMEVFVRIVEKGSLSAVARELGTTQPSVSRQLRALERHLKTGLLHRSTRHVALTEEGRAYYEDCKRILADVGTSEGNLASLHTTLRGTLKVNTSVALGVDYIAPLANSFQRHHPDLTVDLTLNERFVDLVEEGLDVAIRFGPIRDENLIARELGSTRRLTVAAPGYLRRHGVPRQPADLASHVCVAFNYAPATEWNYHGPQGEVRVKVTGAFRSNNGHAIRGAILAGIGIGWLPEALIHEQLQSGKLKTLFPGYSMSPIGVHAVYASARHVPAKVRAFVQFLEEQFKRLPVFAAITTERRSGSDPGLPVSRRITAQPANHGAGS